MSGKYQSGTLLSSSSSSGSSPPPPPGAMGRQGGMMSGAGERRLLLLCANALLLLLGLALILTTAVLLGAFLLAQLSFVSALFSAAPILLLCAGAATCLTACAGLALWRKGRASGERSAAFRLLAVALIASCLLCLASSVVAFLLRETIAHTFGSTRVSAQLSRYDSDDSVKSRWDSLQRAYQCCGGGDAAYFDYADVRGDIAKGEQRVSTLYRIT